MKSYKSLVITSGNFPYGGCTANFVRNFVKGMLEQGVQTEVILLKGNEKEILNQDSENFPNIRYRYFLFRKQPVSFSLKLIQFLIIVGFFPWYLFVKILTGNYKIIYLYGIEYPYLTIPYLLICKILKRKCIRIITDYYSQTSVASTWWRKPKWFFYKLEFDYIDRYFTKIIVLSDLLKEKLIQSKVRPDKIIRTLHFIDFNHFRNPDDILPENRRNYTIGYIGTLSISNGIDVLLEAFDLISSDLSNVRLLIVGDLNYESGIKEKVESYIKQSGREIITPGFQSLEKIRQYYQECDILVNPRISSISADAGFPTKVGEYMSTGKPVILTAVGYFKDPLFQKETGVLVIEPDNPQVMAQAFQTVIGNYNHYLNKSLLNIDWVRRNLDYLHNSQVVLNFITK